jgi:exopolyphosphatase/guanosine-5'-triphosphate,3'-diphosphate pyrophosphatase
MPTIRRSSTPRATMGRRFFFDEAHAMQVMKLAMAMFDQLAGLHRLPMAVRPYLEVAAVLARHRPRGQLPEAPPPHRVPGAQRRHSRPRRSRTRHRGAHRPLPSPQPSGFAPSRHGGLVAGRGPHVRKLATLLRVADALDRSHAQPIGNMRAELAAERSCCACSRRARQTWNCGTWSAKPSFSTRFLRRAGGDGGAKARRKGRWANENVAKCHMTCA